MNDYHSTPPMTRKQLGLTRKELKEAQREMKRAGVGTCDDEQIHPVRFWILTIISPKFNGFVDEWLGGWPLQLFHLFGLACGAALVFGFLCLGIALVWSLFSGKPVGEW